MMAFQSYMHQKAHEGKEKFNSSFLLGVDPYLGDDYDYLSSIPSTTCRFYRGLIPLLGRNIPCNLHNLLKLCLVLCQLG